MLKTVRYMDSTFRHFVSVLVLCNAHSEILHKMKGCCMRNNNGAVLLYGKLRYEGRKSAKTVFEMAAIYTRKRTQDGYKTERFLNSIILDVCTNATI